ncbi:MAG: hypothetical protein Q9227_002288 [Pyrenula ochraceoflavens]
MLEILLDHFTLGRLVLALILLSILYAYIREFVKYRQVDALGARAPVPPYKLPGALDFVYQGVSNALNHQNLQFWQWFFESSGGAEYNNYTIEVNIAGQFRTILTADPENIKAILTAQFSDYGKGEHFHEEWKDFLGDSIFNTDHEKWSKSRQLLRPMFARERVGDLIVFENHLQKLLPMCGPGDGRVIDISALFYRYTLDAATDFILGRAMGSLDEENNEFATVFAEVQRVQSIITRAGPFKFLVARRTFKHGLRRLNEMLEPYIHDVLAMSPEELEQKLSKTDTFLHTLARFTRDPKVIRDQLVAVLLAGRDTTAATLSWTFMELARHPKVVEKLRREINERLGPDGQPPSYTDLKEMKYLTYIINETLRLYPAVPYNVRYSLTDTTLPRGGGMDGSAPVGVRKGTGVGYSTLLMQRRADLYPPISKDFPFHPSEWAPERWSTWTPRTWHYIPFNGGPRICIGQQFAIIEMAYTICRFFQHFEAITDFGNRTVLKSDIILTPADGVKVGLWRSRGLSPTKV